MYLLFTIHIKHSQTLQTFTNFIATVNENIIYAPEINIGVLLYKLFIFSIAICYTI